jgi:molybdopterin synthase sulfur carrier subunit
MVKIEFLGPIAKEPIYIKAATLKDIGEFLKSDKHISKWLAKCAIAVNDEIVKEKNIILKDGDKISILPPVCGG